MRMKSNLSSPDASRRFDEISKDPAPILLFKIQFNLSECRESLFSFTSSLKFVSVELHEFFKHLVLVLDGYSGSRVRHLHSQEACHPCFHLRCKPIMSQTNDEHKRFMRRRDQSWGQRFSRTQRSTTKTHSH